jgi:hypothetical protein
VLPGVVTPQPLTPPRVGLIASAPTIPTSDDRWTAGFSYDPENCDGEIRLLADCNEETPADPPTNRELVEYMPFVIEAVDRCSTMTQSRDREGRVTRLLAAAESKAIESELWRGTKARAMTPDWPNRYLTSNDAEVLTDIPSDPGEALGCLEQYLADCQVGGRGMIHASRDVVTAWARAQLLRREGNLILTILDTIVVPGAGYDGSGPATSAGGAPQAPADSDLWAYATGIVAIRLGSVTTQSDPRETIDRSTNTQELRAQRFASAVWDCCHGAIAIDATRCTVQGS